MRKLTKSVPGAAEGTYRPLPITPQSVEIEPRPEYPELIYKVFLSQFHPNLQNYEISKSDRNKLLSKLSGNQDFTKVKEDNKIDLLNTLKKSLKQDPLLSKNFDYFVSSIIYAITITNAIENCYELEKPLTENIITLGEEEGEFIKGIDMALRSEKERLSNIDGEYFYTKCLLKQSKDFQDSSNRFYQYLQDYFKPDSKTLKTLTDKEKKCFFNVITNQSIPFGSEQKYIEAIEIIDHKFEMLSNFFKDKEMGFAC